MARSGQYIVDGAWIIAQDNGAPVYGQAIDTSEAGTRWSPVECLRWINDVRTEIVGLLPKAYTRRATPTLAAGTRQTLSGLGLTDGIQPIDIPRNYSLDGVTPGRPITKLPRIQLDDSGTYWHNEQGTEVFHWTYDEDDPEAFYVYPASPVKVELLYSAIPADLASLADPILLSDIYANAVMYGLLARMYAKDATYGKNVGMAATYQGLMAQSLGIRGSNVTAADARRTQKAAGA